MREIPYTVIQTHAADGRPMTLAYSILVSGGDSEPEHYGVKIVERNSGGHAQALDLTMDAKRVYDLLDKLSRNTVTPTGLMDVLADWL